MIQPITARMEVKRFPKIKRTEIKGKYQPIEIQENTNGRELTLSFVVQ